MKLTKTDYAILNSYRFLLDGLAEYLGSGYEIVLHSLENYEHSAIKVINGHFTGRAEGAPITDLAVRMLTEIKESGNIYQSRIYVNRNAKGVPMHCATIPIIGENNRIIGLLCMNFHTEIPFYDVLNNLLSIHQEKADNSIETYTNNSDELISSAVMEARTAIMNNPTISVSNRNKEVIYMLQEKGIFQLKDAVAKVANYLGISKNTVYLHLRNMPVSNAEE